MSVKVDVKGKIDGENLQKFEKNKKGQCNSRDVENLRKRTTSDTAEISVSKQDKKEKIAYKIKNKFSNLPNPFKRHEKEFTGNESPRKKPPNILRHAASAEQLPIMRSKSDPIERLGGSFSEIKKVPIPPLNFSSDEEPSKTSHLQLTPRSFMANIRRKRSESSFEKSGLKIVEVFENLISVKGPDLPASQNILYNLLQEALILSIKKLGEINSVSDYKAFICKYVLKKIQATNGPFLDITYDRIQKLKKASKIYYFYKLKEIEQSEKNREFIDDFEKCLKPFENKDLKLTEFNLKLRHLQLESPACYKTIAQALKPGWLNLLNFYEQKDALDKLKMLLSEVVDLAFDLNNLPVCPSRKMSSFPVQAKCYDLVRTHLGGLGMGHADSFGYSHISLENREGKIRHIYLDKGSEREIFGQSEQSEYVPLYFKFLITEICKIGLHPELTERAILYAAREIALRRETEKEKETLMDWEIFAYDNPKKFKILATSILYSVGKNFFIDNIAELIADNEIQVQMLIHLFIFLTKPKSRGILEKILELVPKNENETQRQLIQKKILLLIANILRPDWEPVSENHQEIIEEIRKEVLIFRKNSSLPRKLLNCLEGGECPIFIMKLLALTAGGLKKYPTENLISEYPELFGGTEWYKHDREFRASFKEDGHLNLFIQSTEKGFQIYFNRNLDILHNNIKLLSLGLENVVDFSDFKITFSPYALVSVQLHPTLPDAFLELYEKLGKFILIMNKGNEEDKILVKHKSFKKVLKAISSDSDSPNADRIDESKRFFTEQDEEEIPELVEELFEKGKEKEKGFKNEEK